MFGKLKTLKSHVNQLMNDNDFLSHEEFEQKFEVQIDYLTYYSIIRCLKKSSDFENIGSKLFDFLSKNKIENTFFNLNSLKITNVQIERILHGATLKSYSFEIYKTKNYVIAFIGTTTNCHDVLTNFDKTDNFLLHLFCLVITRHHALKHRSRSY